METPNRLNCDLIMIQTNQYIDAPYHDVRIGWYYYGFSLN